MEKDVVDKTDELLAFTGSRVRELRALRGISRKVLSSNSGVSERYLAQLEKGEGNISLALLQRVASVLRVDIGELVVRKPKLAPEITMISEYVQQLEPEIQQEVLQYLHKSYPLNPEGWNHLALIGLRGAGKTTLGRILAAQMKVPFVRLVSEIERLAGMHVSVLLSEKGQTEYRELEFEALQATMNNYKNCVIEAGGSIVSEANTYNTLLSNCYCIWLQTSPKEHVSRVQDQGDHRFPVGQEKRLIENITTMLDEREPFYRQAHATLSTGGATVAQSVEALIDLLPFDCAPDEESTESDSVL